MKQLRVDRTGMLTEGHLRLEETDFFLGVVGGVGSLRDALGDCFEELLGLEVENLPAVDAEVPLARRLVATAGAGDRRVGLLGGVGVDLDAVHLGVLRLGRLATEPRDVPRDDRAPTGPALAVLDERLGLVLFGQPVGVALAEVGRRDLLRDVDAPGCFLEDLEEALVGQPLGVAELGPEEVIAIARVGGEPLLDVGDGLDEVDVVRPALPVDAELEAVVGVRDVADAEVEQLPTAEAGLELEGDQGGVAVVRRRLDHREDVVLVVQHVGGVRRRVVVRRRLAADPGDAIGNGIVLGRRVLPEVAERDAIVAVGLGSGILPLNPLDERLGGLLRGPGVVIVAVLDQGLVEEGVGVLGDARVVAEHLHLPVPADGLPPEHHLARVVVQQLPIPLTAPALALLDAFTEGLRSLFRVDGHGASLYPVDCKGMAEIPPVATTNPFNSALKGSPAAAGPSEVVAHA